MVEVLHTVHVCAFDDDELSAPPLAVWEEPEEPSTFISTDALVTVTVLFIVLFSIDFLRGVSSCRHHRNLNPSKHA
jgi:hypothetical protein